MSGKRTLLLIVVGVVFGCVLLGLFKGYDAVWSIWRIPALAPPFADAISLTSGAESLALGHDPLYFNPCDPWQRPMNYPRMIQPVLLFLKINQSHTNLIGFLFIALFLLGIFLFLKKINNATALVLATVIFSPAIVLGIERANYDLFVFFLLSLALLASSIPLLSTGLLLFASFVKLFPIFALTYVFRYSKRTRIIASCSFVTLFLSYIILSYSDWKQVFKVTLKGTGILAYGVQSFLPGSHLETYIPLGAVVMSTLVFYANTIYTQGFKQENDAYIDAFRIGAGIYVGTFFLGNNWAYRLVFLIFTIPQLVAWLRTSRNSFISLIVLISIVFSCWSIWVYSLLTKRLVIAIDEVFNWILMASLLYLMLSSMPYFIQRSIMNFVSLARLENKQISDLWLRFKTLYHR